MNGGTGLRLQDTNSGYLVREIQVLALKGAEHSQVLFVLVAVPTFITGKACIPLVFHIGLAKIGSISEVVAGKSEVGGEQGPL